MLRYDISTIPVNWSRSDINNGTGVIIISVTIPTSINKSAGDHVIRFEDVDNTHILFYCSAAGAYIKMKISDFVIYMKPKYMVLGDRRTNVD